MEDHSDPLAGLLARMLSHVDLCKLATLNRNWNQSAQSDECWDVLLQRDFPVERMRIISVHGRSVSNKRQWYISVFRTRLNWSQGRSLPPIAPSKRSHRLLLVNEENVVVDVGTRDGSVRAWRPSTIAAQGNGLQEVELSSLLPENGSEQLPRSIIDCALSSGHDIDELTLLCGGLNGGWIQRLNPSTEDSPPSARTDLVSSIGRAVHRVARCGTLLAASASGEGDDVMVWDACRPDTVIAKLASMDLGDSVGLHFVNERMVSVVYSNGKVVDVDLRCSDGEGHGRAALATSLRVDYPAKSPLNDPIQASCITRARRVFSTARACVEYDVRMFQPAGSRRELNLWEVRHVSSLAYVNDSTIVAGMLQGWEGPIVTLGDDGTVRRLLYSSERNYRVSRLQANCCALATTCTDWNRLFIFSPPTSHVLWM